MATAEETKQKLQEIANRGLQDRLDPRQRAIFDEAVNRGLIQVSTESVESGSIDINELLKKAKGIGEVASRIATDIPIKVTAGAMGLRDVVEGEGQLGAQRVRETTRRLQPELSEEGMEVAGGVGGALQDLAKQPGIDKIVEGSKSFGEFLTKVGEITGASLQDPFGTARTLEKTGEAPQTTGAAIGGAIGQAAPETALDVAALTTPLKSGIAKIRAPKEIANIAKESTKATRQLMSEAAPSITRLKEAARNVYNQIDDIGVTVKQDAFQKFANQTLKMLERKGLDPDISPKAFAAVNRMVSEAEAGGVSVSKIDTLRQVAKGAAKAIEGKDKALGSMMVERIDDFLETLTPKKVIGGQPKEVGQLFKNARDLWGRAKKSELIEDAIDKASRQDSGFENGLRVKFRSLLNNKKAMKGFNSQEKMLMKKVVDGTRMANLARLGGKFGLDLKQNTNALGAALGAGAGGVYGGGVGAIVVPIVGSVSRRLAEKLTSGNVKLAQDVIKAGKNGNEIVNAYLRNTPKDQQSVAELTELLMRPGVELGKVKSGSQVGQDAAYFAKTFTPEQISAALGISAPATKELADQATLETSQ